MSSITNGGGCPDPPGQAPQSSAPSIPWRGDLIALSSFLIRRRKDLKITQAAVADWLGISTRQWRRFETGESLAISAPCLFQAAALLGVRIFDPSQIENGDQES